MSVSFSPSATPAPFVSAPRQRSATQDKRPEEHHFPLARQLAVISEMVDTLDTLTVPGKRQTMMKVVGFIQNQTSHARLALGPRNQNILAELVRRLTHETLRQSPDVHVFIRRAKSLVALLRVVA